MMGRMQKRREKDDQKIQLLTALIPLVAVLIELVLKIIEWLSAD